MGFRATSEKVTLTLRKFKGNNVKGQRGGQNKKKKKPGKVKLKTREICPIILNEKEVPPNKGTKEKALEKRKERGRESPKVQYQMLLGHIYRAFIARMETIVLFVLFILIYIIVVSHNRIPLEN
jgi:hypothetical protein